MHKRLIAVTLLLLACGGKLGVKDARIAPSEDWMGIYINNAKIGYVYSRQEIKGNTYRFTQKSTMKLELLGSDEEFATNLVAVTDRDLNLEEFTFDISSRKHTFYAEGKREGEVIKVKIETAGRTETKEIKAKDALISPALASWVAAQSPKPGDKLNVTVFEPTLLKTLPVSIKVIAPETLTVNGERIPVLKMETRMMGLKSEAWVDSTGSSVKEIQQPGIVMIRESREKALEEVSGAAKLDLLSFFAVRPDSAIQNPRELKELKLKVKGLSADEELSISSSTQKAKKINGGVEFTITSPDTSKIKRSSMPMSEPCEFLSSSFYIQTEDPQIKRTSSRIVGDETDAMSAALKLVNWVYRNLRKRATASVPSAVEVLETREGDCNEHAILLAALGRAAGIPTKINVGLVYLNGAFYYHAWNSFFIGGTWVPADATFGQLPADPTHVQLHEGELDEQARVLSVVGEIEIDVISYR
jgi:ribosomal protein L31